MSATEPNTSIESMSKALHEGADADIFFDAHSYGDEDSAAAIQGVIVTMKRSAKLLERVSTLMEVLHDTIDVDGDMKTMDFSSLLRAMNAVDAAAEPSEPSELSDVADAPALA